MGKRKANFLNTAVFPLQEAFIALERAFGKRAPYIEIIKKSKIMENLPKEDLWQKNCIKFNKIL
jgi:hypothetical protein